MPSAAAALLGRERGGDDGEGGGHHAGRADALEHACPDQQLGAPGEAAEQRRDGEDGKAEEEDAPAPEHVGELAAGEHEDGEAERVAGDDPFELSHVDPEVALDGREGHVHDGVVEHDHEEGERHRRQCPPLPVFLREDPCLHRFPASVGVSNDVSKY